MRAITCIAITVASLAMSGASADGPMDSGVCQLWEDEPNDGRGLGTNAGLLYYGPANVGCGVVSPSDSDYWTYTLWSPWTWLQELAITVTARTAPDLPIRIDVFQPILRPSGATVAYHYIGSWAGLGSATMPISQGVLYHHWAIPYMVVRVSVPAASQGTGYSLYASGGY